MSWSHSRLQSFETCPKRHNEVDKLALYTEGPNAARDYGSEVHSGLEHRCRSGVPLPPALESYEDIALKIDAIPGRKLFEQQLAINKVYQPTEYFADDVWLRVVIDVLVISETEPTVAAAIDYKTGKRKDDFSQLQLNAAVIFAHYPQIFTVETCYWWICTKGRPVAKRTFTRHGDLASIWNKFLPKVKAYENALANNVFPPRPSGLCKKYCPVVTCPFHGKGGA